jgi:murein DD-endopeptidase MepM/ murein hydrolase activator NlpD
MRLRLLLVSVTLPLVLWAALPLVSGAAAPQSELRSLERKIDRTRDQIGRKKGTERELSTDISGYTRRIGRLQGRITTLGRRQSTIEADLRAKREELKRLQADLRSERARLTRLRARLTETRAALSDRLVQIYKTEDPDLVGVVLNSDGFADLLERTEFLRRISDADREIVQTVRRAKADATETERRLDRLERRQKRVTETIQVRRDEVAGVKQELIGTRVGFSRTKAGKDAALVKVRGERGELQEDLSAMERSSGQIRSRLRQAAARSGGGGAGASGPFKQGSGQLITPTAGTFTSPFGPRWGRLHAGVDIAAPTGTVIRAADSGKVVLLGFTGGYGNYTCIQHTSSMSTCYAHQSSYSTSSGASVRKGQAIGRIGNTGNSTGPHLHFEVRINGNPVDPMGYL